MNWILSRTGHPLPEPDDRRWLEWMKKNESKKRIDVTHVGGAIVSTVFLGIDHNVGGNGQPVLFETMIFGGEEDGFQFRYVTRDEAEAGHKLAVEQLTLKQKKLEG